MIAPRCFGRSGRPLRAGGVEAEVLRGRAAEAALLFVLWRDPSVESPCDVHVLLITGADPAIERELLAGLQ